jgi:RimJ/RimL family protein N-acetyltransferase
MKDDVQLRDVSKDDLPTFFEQQLDPEANYMAAFTAKDPTDREAFMAHWDKIMRDDSIPMRTILFEGQIAGYVSHHSWFGEPEVTYWIDKKQWGKGIATRALQLFLEEQAIRPLYGRVVKDNVASRRVLEKCGFVLAGQDKGFAQARGQEVEELILVCR